MKLILPMELVERLRGELHRAGNREIGGVLVGEHLHGETFRIVDLSVQRTGGSASHFVRDVEHNRAFLKDFSARTGNDYQRFNYLGEWHSHPSFAPVPSEPDLRAMREIVEDPQVGVNFAILIIVSPAKRSLIKLSATAFRANMSPVAAGVELEGNPAQKQSWLRRFIDLFR